VFILIALILAAGCAKPTPAATATPTYSPAPKIQPTATTAPTKASTKAPTKAATKVPVSALKVAMVIDDFESAKTDWIAGMEPEYGDSSSTSAVMTMDHPFQGTQALQLSFDQNDKPKAIFYVDRELDLSKGAALQFDIYNPGVIDGVGVSFTTGADKIWQESDSYPAGAGKTTTLTFDLTASNYKTAASNWEFTASLNGLDKVNRLAIIIYPAKDGSVYLDNIVLLGTK
jgi:hypothetical protein